MIELSILHEYKITIAQIATAANRDGYDEKEHFLQLSSHANQDGSLTTFLKIFDKNQDINILANLKGGETRFHDLSTILSDREKDWSSGKLDENFLLINKSNEVVLIPENGLGTPIHLKITNRISDFKINATVSASFRPYRPTHLLGHSGIVPVPLETGSSEPKRLAFLHVNETLTTAQWQTWKNQETDGSKKSWLKQLFSADKITPEILPEENLVQLTATDFPASHRPPMFEQALIRKNQVYTYVMDTWGSFKYGFNFSTLVTINNDGRKLEALYWDDHRRHKNEKKYGVSGKFTASGKYCILESIYASTSEWKGKQRLLDLDTKELLEIKMPKGYAAYSVTDHIDGYFWLLLNDGKTIQFVCSKSVSV